MRVLNLKHSLPLVVFVAALAMRLWFLSEYRDVPYYDRPFSDSERYQQRALEIADGDWLGERASFLGSPLYPYFLALVYTLFGVNFTVLYWVQIVLGSVTCVLIYRLARALGRGSPWPAFAAGLLAAFYGTFGFYDATILATTIELVLLCGSVALIVSDRPAGGRIVSSGLLLGLAALARPNLAVVAPLVVLWLLWSSSRIPSRGAWRNGLLYAAGFVLAISPVTIRNYVASGDFVPISSSAGINLFIGNNPEANGRLSVPAGSGLDVSRLYDSSKTVAESATGREDMRPSEISRYWSKRAVAFMRDRPGEALRLALRKLEIFWNHYEIPNVHNKYFVAHRFAPSLDWMFVGFGIVAPFALVGIVLSVRRRDGVRNVGWLYAGLVLVYMLSVLPFFVTARYRIAVVPFLIVFAVTAGCQLWQLIRARDYRLLVVAIALGAAMAVWTNRSLSETSYWLSRAAVGKAYVDLAREHPDRSAAYLDAAVIELKKAAELSPNTMAPRFYLAEALYLLGFYSAAAGQFEAALGFQPDNTLAARGLEAARAAREEQGDRIDASSLPTTPLERALQYRRAGNAPAAERELLAALESDPQHARAYNELGYLYSSGGRFETAIDYYEQGLRYAPDNPVLLKNLGFAYAETKRYAKARKTWERALEVAPNDQSLVRALRDLPSD